MTFLLVGIFFRIGWFGLIHLLFSTYREEKGTVNWSPFKSEWIVRSMDDFIQFVRFSIHTNLENTLYLGYFCVGLPKFKKLKTHLIYNLKAQAHSSSHIKKP